MFKGRFSSSCGLLGIDIGSHSIKMLQLRRHGSHLAVVGAAETSLVPTAGGPAGPAARTSPTSVVRSDSIPTCGLDTTESTDQRVTTATLGEQLRAVFTAGGFTGRRCVVSLPRTDLFVQHVRLPKMPEHELRQAARWEAAERFGLDPDASEVDIIRTGPSGSGGAGGGGGVDLLVGAGGGAASREEVLIVAAPHAVIHARTNPILEAGLRPVAIDTHFCALTRIFSRQFRRETDRQFVRIVLEVGASGSTVLILRGSEIAFCKLIKIGGREFNQAVAEHLQLDVASAAELRAARMHCASVARTGDAPGIETATAENDPATDRAIYEAIRPLLGELVKDVALCLRYYGVTFRGKPAYQIILTGGECLEPHLAQMLRNACKLPVVFDDEPETLTRLLPGIGSILHRTPGSAAQWAVAAGLSIRNLDQGESRIEDRCEVRNAEAAGTRSQKPEPVQKALTSDVRPLTSGKEAA